jgi:two-component system LytT family response regulator
MIRTIIIDDEAHCIDRLSLLLNNFDQEILLMEKFQDAEAGKNGILKLRPDLVFLDVQLNNRTGFDILKEIQEINFDVIFTTAFEKFAVQAFKFSAIDFLLKPIVEDDLRLAVDKLLEKKSLTDKVKTFETLFHNLQGKGKRIAVHTVTGFNYINAEDIIRCESDVNYTTLFLKDKAQLTVAKTLKEFEELLSDHGFYRVHNSHLINTLYIKSFNKGKGGFVTLLDNKQIEVSSRRKEGFLEYLKA